MGTKEAVDLLKKPAISSQDLLSELDTKPAISSQDLLSELDTRLHEMESLMKDLPDKKERIGTRENSKDDSSQGLSEALEDSKGTKDTEDSLTSEDEYYPMTHPHRGDCLVFVNTKFKGGNLPHTQDDLRAYRKTFQALGFTVTVYKDINKDCLMRTLREAGEQDRTDHDALVVIFSSHGNTNTAGREVLSTYDGRLDSALLWANFMKSKSLAGKPKLFFIDACRGGGLDDRVQVGMSVSTDSIDDKKPLTAPVFYHPDILVVNSSYAGMMSTTFKGSDFKGSVFTQMLCRTLLEEKNSEMDLMDQLQKVTRLVAARYSKQIPQTSSTLTRGLRFRCR